MTVLAQTENPQALAQTGGTPRGGCAAGLPAVAGQPSLICVPAAHLSSWPCWAHSHSEQLGRAAASLSAAVLGVLPHYLSMATAAQRSPATSYANESRPQMSAATTAPSPSLLSLLLKVTVVRYPDSAFENTFPTF